MTGRPARSGFRNRLQVLVLVAAGASVGNGCAQKRFVLPSGPSTPLMGFAQIFGDATTACRGIDSMSAEAAVSGRAGGTRLRGRILAGMARPDSLRLEGVAPFGAPVFILAARGAETVLLLPRDHRVLTGVPAADILEALVGLSLSAGQMRALLSGCVTPEPEPVSGRAFGTDWMAVELAGDATAYLIRTATGPAIAAATIGRFTVEYVRSGDRLPAEVHIRSGDAMGATPTELTLKLSQVETNVPLGADVFSLDVPEDAIPLSLEELRASGPLGR